MLKDCHVEKCSEVSVHDLFEKMKRCIEDTVYYYDVITSQEEVPTFLKGAAPEVRRGRAKEQ